MRLSKGENVSKSFIKRTLEELEKAVELLSEAK